MREREIKSFTSPSFLGEGKPQRGLNKAIRQKKTTSFDAISLLFFNPICVDQTCLMIYFYPHCNLTNRVDHIALILECYQLKAILCDEMALILETLVQLVLV